jgi:mannose-6-phosphate isomerase-like protein (cupin superfamily)
MKGYVPDIEKAAQQNKTFRKVLYTAKNCQLVVMSLKPSEDIGAEVHKLDQFFRVEEGEGKAVLDGVEHKIKPGFAILVPAGARHNIINGPSGPMYTLYARTIAMAWCMPPRRKQRQTKSTSTGRRLNSVGPKYARIICAALTPSAFLASPGFR